jgi:predicted DCC family thiol-disulfide oxidoreductase YuxK
LVDDRIARHDRHLLAELDAEQTYGSFHVVHPDGRIESAGAGLTAIIGALPFGSPFAGVMRRLPGVTEAAYDWFADHREEISQMFGLADHPQKDPAEKP